MVRRSAEKKDYNSTFTSDVAVPICSLHIERWNPLHISVTKCRSFCERLTEFSPYCVHILRGIISSGIFLPLKDEMAQTTHIILDSIPWLLSKYKSLPQGLLNIQIGMEWEWHNI